MPTIDLVLPPLHRGQRAILRQSCRFNVLVNGRRWGKTTIGIDRATDALLDGQPVGWFAPTYKLLSESWREIKKQLAPLIKPRGISEQERRLELITGGVLDCWTMDGTDPARGRKYRRVIIDEAGLERKLEAVLNEAILATLTDLKGDAWLLGTPKGSNFFKVLFMRGLDLAWRARGWRCWRMPSITNPYLDPEEIELAQYNLLGWQFEQEYLAKFVQSLGAVFRKIRQAIRGTIVAPYEGTFVGGIDFGRETDSTVITILDTARRQVVDLDRFTRTSWAMQRDRIKTMVQKWKPRLVYAEANSFGGPNIEALQAEDLPIVGKTTTHGSKLELVQSLALAFEQQQIGIIDDPTLIAELGDYQQFTTKTGRVTYGSPLKVGAFDDTVISLGLSWRAMLDDSPLVVA